MALEKIRRESGCLTAEAVLAGARGTALERFFEWDDTLAAHQRRLDQARRLLACIEVTIISKGEDHKTRAYFPVIRGTDEPRSFEPTAKILSNPEWRRQVLTRALHELAAFKIKYARLTELAAVFSAIDAATARKKSRIRAG